MKRNTWTLVAWAVIICSATLCNAQQLAAPEKEPLVACSLGLPVLSSYVWRGYTINDGAVFQPSLTLEKWGISANGWWNCDIEKASDGKRGFSEFDPSISYSLPFETVEVSVGATRYKTSGTKATYEGSVTAGFPNKIVTPAVEIYQGLDGSEGMNGLYASFSLSHEFELGNNTIAAAASTGYGDCDFNVYLFAVDQGTVSDGSAAVTWTYAFNEKFSASMAGKYVWLWSADIRDACEAVGMDAEQAIGSISADLSF